MDGPVSKAVRVALREILLEKKPSRVISGMALGVDFMWAEEALELKIPVIAAVPFVGQEARWAPTSKVRYSDMLAHPYVTTVVCAPGGPSNHKYLHRDRWMVDHCDELVACWDGSAGGTRYTVIYAREIGKPITYVRPTNVARTEWRIEKPLAP